MSPAEEHAVADTRPPSRISSMGLLFAALHVLAVLFVALRFVGLDRSSLWVGEGFNTGLSMDWSYYTPLNFLYLGSVRLWVQAFGMSEAAQRVLPALESIAAIGAVNLTGRRLIDHKAGVTAAACMALLPIDFFHAREAKHYTLHLLTATIFILTFARYRDDRSKGNLVLLALAGMLNLLCMPFFICASALLALSLLVRGDGRAMWIRVGLVFVGALVTALTAVFLIKSLDLQPYAAFIGLRPRVSDYLPLAFFTSTAPLSAFLSTYAIYISGGIRFGELIQNPAVRTGTGAAGLLVLGFVIAWCARDAQREPKRRAALAILGVWLCAVPVVLIYFQHVMGFYPYANRYALGAAPAIAILLGWAFSRSIPDGTSSQRSPLVGAALALYLLIASTSNAAFFTIFWHDWMYPWRSFVPVMATSIEGRTLILTNPDDADTLWYYLDREKIPRQSVTIAFAENQIPAVAYDRVILLEERYLHRFTPDSMPAPTGPLVPIRWIRRPLFPVFNHPPALTATVMRPRVGGE